MFEVDIGISGGDSRFKCKHCVKLKQLWHSVFVVNVCISVNDS